MAFCCLVELLLGRYYVVIRYHVVTRFSRQYLQPNKVLLQVLHMNPTTTIHINTCEVSLSRNI